MREKAPPAMPFFGKDAYTDESFVLLDWAAQGLFWRLAYWQWDEGDIPSDVDLVVAVVGKPRDTRKLWPAMTRLFAPAEREGRIANRKVAELRDAAFEARKRRQAGAEMTNQKLGHRSTPSDTPSVTLSGTDSGTLRAANANAIGSSVPEGVQGEPSPPAELSTLAAIVHKIEALGLNPPPPEQLILAWIGNYGDELMLETIHDAAGACAGKHFNYFAAILNRRQENPNERPSNRARTDRRGASGEARRGKGTARPISAAEFGHRELDADGEVSPVSEGAPGGPDVPVH